VISIASETKRMMPVSVVIDLSAVCMAASGRHCARPHARVRLHDRLLMTEFTQTNEMRRKIDS
jgi:hypothetical protein